VDTIELIDLLHPTGFSTTLVKGSDFYMQPVWSSDSRQFAWVEWDQPQMPWQGTRLMLADLDPITGTLNDPVLVDGSKTTPVLQPAFSPGSRSCASRPRNGTTSSSSPASAP
jgi:hypothetical protein